jgi:hypothetical protein
MSRNGAIALLKAPFLAFGRTYNAHAQRRPMATGLVTTVVKTSAADLFAQKVRSRMGPSKSRLPRGTACMQERAQGASADACASGSARLAPHHRPCPAPPRPAPPAVSLPLQVMEGKEWEEVDWRRHVMFCTFGFVYLVSRREGGRTQSPPVAVPAAACRRRQMRGCQSQAPQARTSPAPHGCDAPQGGFQYWLYNNLFVRMCSGMTARLGHRGSAPIKTFIDQAIQ